MLELRKYIKNIILESIDTIVYNFLKNRRFSDEDNRKHMFKFTGKDGINYIIRKEINSDIFKVYDFDKLKNDIENGKNIYLKPVATAVFDTTSPNFITGFKENESIFVDGGYRRNGIASAMLDFAEQFYGVPYKPSSLLSHNMQKLVDKRFS